MDFQAAIKFIDDIPESRLRAYAGRIAGIESVSYSTKQIERLIKRIGKVDGLAVELEEEIDILTKKSGLNGR